MCIYIYIYIWDWISFPSLKFEISQNSIKPKLKNPVPILRPRPLLFVLSRNSRLRWSIRHCELQFPVPTSLLLHDGNALSSLHQIHPLAKHFFPFLNRTLSLLPKCLSSSSNDQFSLDLLNIYQLCLTCLDSLSSHLSSKPYPVHVQRLRLGWCWGRGG